MDNNPKKVASKNATQQKRKRVRIRTLKQVKEDAKNLPEAQRLFGDMIYANETTIIAGDTNVGKSILAFLIANGIASGSDAIEGIENESKEMKTVLIDMELSDRQISKRIGNTEYNDNLLRMDSDPDCIGCSICFEDIYEAAQVEKNKVFILDNISAFLQDPAKDGEIAIKFMTKINGIKKELDKTFIVIAHVPKRYETTPYTNNDISGSKALANFADSIIFIGRSCKGDNIRYIKHTKGRNTIISIDKVYVLELFEVNGTLIFKFLGMDEEKNHLPKDFSKTNRNSRMQELYNSGKYTLEEIGDIYGIDKSNVSRALKKESERNKL
ncbi:MAG: AAA family ATPase [Bacteroidia bacterium]